MTTKTAPGGVALARHSGQGTGGPDRSGSCRREYLPLIIEASDAVNADWLFHHLDVLGLDPFWQGERLRFLHHGERRHSAHLAPLDASWGAHCFGCDATHSEITRELRIPRPRLSLDREPSTSRSTFERDGRPNVLADEQLSWLAAAAGWLDCLPVLRARITHERGISEHIQRIAGLGWTSNGRLTIPIFDRRGRVVNFARYLPPWLRTGDPHEVKLRWSKGRPTWPLILNAQSIGEAEYVLICEGPVDALCAESLGFRAVGAPSASWRDAWSRELADLRVRAVAVCGDGDNAGNRFNEQAVDSLRAVGIEAWAVQLPDNKDLTDLLRAGVSS